MLIWVIRLLLAMAQQICSLSLRAISSMYYKKCNCYQRILGSELAADLVCSSPVGVCYGDGAASGWQAVLGLQSSSSNVSALVSDSLMLFSVSDSLSCHISYFILQSQHLFIFHILYSLTASALPSGFNLSLPLENNAGAASSDM